MTHCGSRPRKVLIVNADPEPRRSLASWLAGQGYGVAEAATGREALQAMERGQIGVALVESDLPDQPGLQVLRQANQTGLAVPVILCTHSWSVARAVEAMKEGAWDYLTRPWQLAHLRSVVDAAMQGAGSAQAPWGWRAHRDRQHAQKLEILGRIAGGVIHDFNNILTVILGFGYVLQDKTDPAFPWRTHLLELVKAAEHGAALTQQLLGFCHNRPAQACEFDLNSTVSKMQSMLARLIGQKVQIVLRLAPDLGPIRADPCQVEQVIMNLALNGRDAMPRGGCLTFTTTNLDVHEPTAVAPSLSPGRYVALCVSDTGAGMNDETKSHLFESFYTTKSERGTGLGLSTVQRIIRGSGGHIAVQSEQGRGTTFSIFWPRAEALPQSDLTVLGAAVEYRGLEGALDSGR